MKDGLVQWDACRKDTISFRGLSCSIDVILRVVVARVTACAIACVANLFM